MIRKIAKFPAILGNMLQVGVVEGEDYTFKVTGKPAVQQPGEDPPAEGELSLELHMQYDNSDDEVVGSRLTYRISSIKPRSWLTLACFSRGSTISVCMQDQGTPGLCM